MPDTEIGRFRFLVPPARPAAVAPAADKALRFAPKCLHCGKAKNQHRAFTAECPIGKRTPTGYAGYGSQRFANAGAPSAASPT